MEHLPQAPYPIATIDAMQNAARRERNRAIGTFCARAWRSVVALLLRRRSFARAGTAL
jgi:hypothetical protein